MGRNVDVEFVPIEQGFATTMPPLRDSKTQIRLFRYTSDFPLSTTQGRPSYRFLLDAFDIDRCPPYTALSYEWGSPLPTATILVEYNGSNGVRTKPIRNNLYQFLGRLLYKDLPQPWTWRTTTFNKEPKLSNKLWPHGVESQWLWADAICINQQNLTERNDQVAMMSDIFSRATHVIAWLGDDTGLEVKLAEFCDSRQPFDVSLFRCSFWSRLWCQQEVCLAQKLVLMARNQIEVLSDHLKDHTFHDKVSETVVPRCLHIWRQRNFRRAANLSLEEAIRLFSAKQCANPKDRVFGVLGMVHREERIEVDYTLSVVQVFYSALLRALEVLLGQDHPVKAHRQPVTLAQMKLLSGTFELLAERMGILSSERTLLNQLVPNYQDVPNGLTFLLQQFRIRTTSLYQQDISTAGVATYDHPVAANQKWHPSLIQSNEDTAIAKREDEKNGQDVVDDEDDEVDDWLVTYQRTMAGLGAPLPIPPPRSPSPCLDPISGFAFVRRKV